MSVKKQIILSGAAVAALGMTAAFAGGPELPPVPSDNGFYIHVDAGFAFINWDDTIVNDKRIKFKKKKNCWWDACRDNNHNRKCNRFFNFRDNEDGGAAVGGDIGYQWNEYLATELGFYWIDGPTFQFRFKGNCRDNNRRDNDKGRNADWDGHDHDNDRDNRRNRNRDHDLTTWLAYLAMKLMMPIGSNFDWFFKGGIAYRFTENAPFPPIHPNQIDRNNRALRPLFGTGFEYTFRKDVGTDGFSINVQYLYVSNVFNGNIPAANILLGGIGYFFAT